MREAILIALPILALLGKGIPHPEGAAPIIGAAAFAAAFTKRGYGALLIVFLGLLGGDLLIELTYSQGWRDYGGFYKGQIVNYAIILTLTLLMRQATKVDNYTRLLLAALGGGLGYFLISNGTLWWQSSMYAQTWTGLGECYLMALPFYRNEFLATTLTVSFLYGSLKLSEILVPSLKSQVIKA